MSETKIIGNRLIWVNGEDESKEPIKSNLANAKFVYHAGKYKYIKIKNKL